MATFRDDTTLMPQIRSYESIIKNQKDAIRKEVEKHLEWDPLLRHDLIHHCLNQTAMPIRHVEDTDTTFHSKMLMYRQRLENEIRLGSCILALIDKADGNASTNGSSTCNCGCHTRKSFWNKIGELKKFFEKVLN